MADLLTLANNVTTAVYPTYSNAGVGIAASIVGANNYKTSSTNSNLGTRALVFYKIAGYTGVEATAGTAGGALSNVLRGVQRYAEVYYSTVDTNLVYVALADDTNNAQASSNANDVAGSGTTLAGLKAAIEASAGGTATVTVAAFA
jgi:hypothetical protein